ncbi:hypothetical protein MML48_7g00011999 [Holotrichia oblita]|uniref:Uncharacterized protein n=1 Tax=Holotrichia oblita TaxID=644536 RepID=A0ACB9SRK9_HOLOL|nr:hypothetical protein MML48_7g00011999 [Holotrichia oblita]
MEIQSLYTLSDEEYVIQRAKIALTVDPVAAKAWMITAKTLYPNNFGVQFEAYRIEKTAGHLKEAAKCFSDLIGKFHQHPEFWNEINKVTSALRIDSDLDPEKQFLSKMFKHISPEIQHKLLLITADHCEDTMEHCKLLLLLLQKFHSAIPSHAPALIDTLLSAEKHSHASNHPINNYRKILVCELLPLLNEETTTVELSSKLVYKLLHKAIEYYVHSLNFHNNNGQGIANAELSWDKLCSVLEFTARQLGWDPYLTTFGQNWTKEGYWQKLLTFCQSQCMNMDDTNNIRQLLYCLTVFFLQCLHDYKLSLAPEPCPGQPQTSYFLIEAFVDPTYPSPIIEPKSKRRKLDHETSSPQITVDKPELRSIVNNFLMTVKCWELLNSTEALQRGQLDDALNYIKQKQDQYSPLKRNLRAASIQYLKKNYYASYNHIRSVIEILPTSNNGHLSNCLITGGTQRHLHFLPLTKLGILQMCTKLLVRSILEKAEGNYADLAIGNILVLSQLDWPQEEERLPSLLKQIQQRGAFQYYLFQTYVVNVDILEELTFLWTHQVVLDVVPHLGPRRIGTRGADKGVKEEIRQAIKTQVCRSNDALDQLIISFITKERESILQALM